MKTNKQKAREAATQRPKPAPPRDAHDIPLDNERMDTRCDSCGERFYVDALRLRLESELELKCPYCKRMMLVQHVEYAVAMVIE